MQEISSLQTRSSDSEFDEPLVCLICGFKSETSLISHIERKHKMKSSLYREKFNVKILQRATKKAIENNSNAQKKMLQDPEKLKSFLGRRAAPNQIKHWVRKGFSEDEAIKKVSEFQSEISKKGNNPKTNAMRSKKYSGDKNPMSMQSIAKRNNVDIRDAYKFTPCYGRSGHLHPMFGKKHTHESLKKISSAPHLSRPSWRSKLEEDLANYCSSLEDIKRNQSIKKYNVDILFQNKKIVVEFFGDFWHCNPKRYEDSFVHPILNKTAKEINDRDAEKINNLQSFGYKVIVIWENDWRHDAEMCKEKIKSSL